MELVARFVFTRPLSHYGRRGGERYLKLSSPPTPATRPDLDKLLRSVLDSMQGVALVDDSQVVTIRARKVYGDAPGVDLRWYYLGVESTT